MDGAEAGFGCPTMQHSHQDASRNNNTLHPNCLQRHLSGNRLLFVPHYNKLWYTISQAVGTKNQLELDGIWADMNCIRFDSRCSFCLITTTTKNHTFPSAFLIYFGSKVPLFSGIYHKCL